MAVPFTTPLSEIEGIGPAAGERLADIDAHSVFDLLRADARTIHSAVEGIASLDEVRAWRQMAAMLEVRSVTPQWAEALVKAGVKTHTALRDQRLDELEAAFEDQRAAGVIAEVPNAIQIAEMLKDAATLDASGALMGTVRDHRDVAIEGARVTASGTGATTDSRGRFRLARLRLGGSLELRIEHPDYTTLSELLHQVPSVRSIHVQMFAMQRSAAEPLPERALAQVRGDELPPIAGQPIVAREIERSELDDYDVLRLILLYANGREGKLVSRLLSYEAGQFVVRWARVPLSELPPDPVLREHFWLRGGTFRRMKLSNTKLAAYLDFLTYKRSRVPPAPDAAVDEAAVADRMTAMQSAGLFGRRRRGGPRAG